MSCVTIGSVWVGSKSGSCLGLHRRHRRQSPRVIASRSPRSALMNSYATTCGSVHALTMTMRLSLGSDRGHLMRTDLRLDFQGRLAFTVIELMIAIAVAGLLLAVLLPAIGAARAAAARTQCVNNLKQITLAYANYVEAARFGPQARMMPLAMSGYLGPAGVDPSFTPTPFDKDHVYPTPPVWLCTTDSVDPEIGAYSYLANGHLGPFGWNVASPGVVGGRDARGDYQRYLLTPKQITDGASSTILLSEQVLIESNRSRSVFFDVVGPKPLETRPGHSLRYSINADGDDPEASAPAGLDFLRERCAAGGVSYSPFANHLRRRRLHFAGIAEYAAFTTVNAPNTPACHFGVHAHGDSELTPALFGSYSPTSFHPGGVNASLADGAVRFFSESISLGLWRSICSSQGNEPVGEF